LKVNRVSEKDNKLSAFYELQASLKISALFQLIVLILIQFYLDRLWKKGKI